jgi:multicomponent Na+:H+ antiporter subunit D
MIPASILIVFIPLVAGVVAFVFRRWRTLEVLIAITGCALMIFILAQSIDAVIGFNRFGIDLDGVFDIFGRSLQVRADNRLPLLLLILCAALLSALSWRTPENWTFIPVGMFVLSALSAALMIRPFQYAALAFVASAALSALMIQAERNGEGTTRGATRYLVVSAIALPMFLGAGFSIDRAGNVTDVEVLATTYAPATQMLVVGFGLLLGAIPLFTWIHPVAKDAPPLTTAFLATIGVGAGTFLLLNFLQEYVWLRENEILLGALRVGGVALLAIVSMVAWAQRSFARVLACGVMLEVGCALLALTNVSQHGVEAVALSVLARAISFGVFGVGVALLRERTNGSDDFEFVYGEGAREPIIALAIAVGGLSMAGLPGTVGFVSHWVSGQSLDPSQIEWLALMVAASLSVAVGVGRGLLVLFVDGKNEQGAKSNEYKIQNSEGGLEAQWALSGSAANASRESKITVSIGVGFVILLGIYPSVMTTLAQQIAAGYTFYP